MTINKISISFKDNTGVFFSQVTQFYLLGNIVVITHMQEELKTDRYRIESIKSIMMEV